jgi:hypothetical protein
LSVLYHEIAAADERHATIVEKIAARYGHTPSQSAGGGIGRALGHLWDKFVGLGSDVWDQLILDVTAKAQSVHRHAAWVHAFEAIGDSESARELSAVLAEEQAHSDALQQALNRVVEQHARGPMRSRPIFCLPKRLVELSRRAQTPSQLTCTPLRPQVFDQRSSSRAEFINRMNNSANGGNMA